MLSLVPPSAQEFRPVGNSRISAKGGEKIGIIDCALSAASGWELEVMEPISTNAQPVYTRNNTDRGVYDIIDHDANSATRVLSETRVTEAQLLDQESIVTEQVGSILCAHERRDRVSLRTIVVRLWDNIVRGRDVRTVFPMMRTGFLSLLGLYGGSRSTERTGHPYEI